MIERCPVCSSPEAQAILSLPPVPIDLNSQVSPDAAATVAKAPVELMVCTACTHLYNRRFDPSVVEYSAAYENTLHYSEHFRAHAEELADRLVADHQLVGATVVEVGSGPGHFLSMLCERGVARAVGFDPSYDPGRMEAPGHAALTIRADVLEPTSEVRADLALSQHVLEHLDDPIQLLATFASVLTDGGAVYSEVPNGELMIDRTALWDILYEHVSYFTPPSMATALARAGLSTTRIATSFGDQFLWAESRVGDVVDVVLTPSVTDELVRRAIAFGTTAAAQIDHASTELEASLRAGPVALWGAGTKGLTYLNLIEGSDKVDAVVDINPRKHGFGVPGTGLTIVGPEVLSDLMPATVLIANPIYRDEISAQLATLGAPDASVVPLWE